MRAAFSLSSIALIAFIALASEANAARCSIPVFQVNISSQGPWPARMRVESGQNCGTRRWTFATITPKRLYLASAPKHGTVVLSAPGGYHYSSSAGYVGNDDFTLKLCGTMNGGFEGCADILFSVSVVEN